MTSTPYHRMGERPNWLCERDVEAVAEFLDPWIAAATQTPGYTEVPLLGTAQWAEADTEVKLAAVAVFVLGCLVERDPVMIAARLAAEIAVVRTARLVAARQASHAISAGADWSAVARRLVQRGTDDGRERRPR
ncbi:hypothetical protein Psed_0033 [Pseudonocardia dioxanivorans CB1190]|uniref:DUF2742 domain-containing protein n=1 Tax=Pseudonocardia dioxanivorans (strain ATCC 55486 / DSM 44775 / JCM 13855 / CB1190) TaxID=675635 RepID=F4CK92_PSEUX|nr:DUF2742 domain-containing protein [Pseudonocardia dioxanivorans]AEA22315.1 hypothetical protein Psed_0033 [Pseudonocardia dioxanivorans CB1190]